jgi:ParB-like nuclease family protein
VGIEKVFRMTGMQGKFLNRAIAEIAASIQEFGWRQPIVVDKQGVVIVGRVRLLAANKLRMMEVPVHVAENLTPAWIRHLLDSRSHEETRWDDGAWVVLQNP